MKNSYLSLIIFPCMTMLVFICLSNIMIYESQINFIEKVDDCLKVIVANEMENENEK